MTIYSLELKKNIKTIIVWACVLAILSGLFLSMYPLMIEDGMKEIMTTKIHSLPADLLKMFGIEEGADLTKISQYLAYVSNYILIAMAVFGINLGQKSLVKEEVQGTIEYLYNKPISRKRIFADKFLSGLTGIIMVYGVIQITMLVSYFLLRNKITESSATLDMVKINLAILYVSLFFYCLGFMISSFLNRENGDSPIGLGIVFLTFFLGLITQIVTKFNRYIMISPIEVFKGGRLLDGKITLVEIGIYSGLAILFVIIGVIRYSKKDFIV